LKEVAAPLAEIDPAMTHVFHPDPQGVLWGLQQLPLSNGYSGCVVWDDPAKSVDLRVVKPTGKSGF
jgi:hypothetical protein